MLFATAFFLLASCAKDVATVAKQDVEPATSGEQRAVEAFNRFVSHLNSDPKTRSAAAVAAPRVVGIRKANTLDYIDGAARTRSAGNGAGVYELELLNPDTTVGYAVVGDEELANEVFAYSPVGSIADTTYNEGLALYFRELALLTAAQEPKTRDNWSIGDGGVGKDPDKLFGDEYWEDGYSAWAHFYENVGGEEYVKQTTASEISLDDQWPRYKYDPIHMWNIYSAYVPTKWNQTEPYNKYVDRFVPGTTVRKKTGCHAVALGQIMAYHRKGKYNYDWNLISNKPVPETDAEKNEVARLLWDIAQRAGTTWTDNNNPAGSTDLDSIKLSIGREGYSFNLVNANTLSGQAASSAKILDEVKNYHRPVAYADVARINGNHNDGHIWVIDGILEQYRWYYWKEFTNTPTAIVIDIYRRLKKGRLHHCNWGWGGESNGWFFDFSAVPHDGDELNFAYCNIFGYLHFGIKFIEL